MIWGAAITTALGALWAHHKGWIIWPLITAALGGIVAWRGCHAPTVPPVASATVDSTRLVSLRQRVDSLQRELTQQTSSIRRYYRVTITTYRDSMGRVISSTIDSTQVSDSLYWSSRLKEVQATSSTVRESIVIVEKKVYLATPGRTWNLGLMLGGDLAVKADSAGGRNGEIHGGPAIDYKRSTFNPYLGYNTREKLRGGLNWTIHLW
jgi:hypothetical protein